MNTTSEKDFLDSLPDSENDFLRTIPDAETNAPTVTSTVAGAITPPTSAPLPTGIGGWMSRIGRAAKETVLSPIAPWLGLGKNKEGQDLAKRMMSPAAGQVGFSQLGQEIGDAGRNSLMASARNTGVKIAESPIANVSPGLAAGLGTAAEMVGQGASLVPMLTPLDVQMTAGTKPIADALKIGWNGLRSELQSLQKSAAGSAVGGIKSIFNKTRGGSERFGEAAVAMQEKGVFGPFTKLGTMEDRASEIQSVAGKTIGDIQNALDKTGKTIVDSSKLADQIVEELTPKTSGGYATRLENEAMKIAETIVGPKGGGPVTLQKLAEVKDLVNPGKWGMEQIANMGEDGQKIFQMRQRATAMIGKAMDDAVESATKETPDIFKVYKDAKQTYGYSSEVLRGITDKINRVTGKRFLDLAASGAGVGVLVEAISRDPVGAAKWAATGGAIKYIERFGPQQGAVMFRALANAMEKAGSGTVMKAAGKATPAGFRAIVNNARQRNSK